MKEALYFRWRWQKWKRLWCWHQKFASFCQDHEDDTSLGIFVN